MPACGTATPLGGPSSRRCRARTPTTPGRRRAAGPAQAHRARRRTACRVVEHRGRLGVADHVRQPIRRILRIQRQERRTRSSPPRGARRSVPADRGRDTPTTAPGPAPSPIRLAANRSDHSSSSDRSTHRRRDASRPRTASARPAATPSRRGPPRYDVVVGGDCGPTTTSSCSPSWSSSTAPTARAGSAASLPSRLTNRCASVSHRRLVEQVGAVLGQ